MRKFTFTVCAVIALFLQSFLLSCENDKNPAQSNGDDLININDSSKTDTTKTDTTKADTTKSDTTKSDTTKSDTTKSDTTIKPDTTSSAKKGLTIYFVRHAETVANASGAQGGEGSMEGHDSLTELGIRQVEALKSYLIAQNIKPDLIIVSPAWRTQKTIEPFLVAQKCTAQVWVELNECCGEEPTGEPLPTERPETRWKMKVEIVAANTIFRSEAENCYWWPGSYEEGLFMVMTARDRILRQYSQSGKTVMIIGHAVNGGVLLGLLRGYDMLTTEPDKPVYLMNTGVQKLTQDTLTGAFTLKQNVNKPPTK